MGDVKERSGASSSGSSSSRSSSSSHGMFVVKRNGRPEKVHFDKITSRIKKLCYGLNDTFVDATVVAQKVCAGVYTGVTTSELDELAAETAAHLTSEHGDYGILAARIAVSNLHKGTNKLWTDTVTDLRGYVEPKTKRHAPMIDEKVYAFIMENRDALNGAIVYDRDYTYDYFGFKTLERSYLLKMHGKIVERPQHMLMRVSCGIHCGDLEAVLETYDYLSNGWFTHASPTLFYAGTPKPALSSCYLLTMKDDSIDGIYSTLRKCALISKGAGGIGLAIHNIRATDSYIAGTNGNSNGLVPMLRVYAMTARYVDQGGNKRKGAFAIYLEPWHADIEAWLGLKKNHGVEEQRARDLFFGLWIPDLFMKRVEADATWSLFCPAEAPGLPDHFGDAFEALYTRYEREPGLARKVMRARDLWQTILDSQTETGTPYMLFKDACNSKSNQKNLGTIRCSNLCTEVVQFTSPDEVAVCNLASVALPMFVRERVFDFAKLNEVIQVMTRNLNRVIDVNHYPVRQAKTSNLRHRPIGIGVQGLADAFIKMRMPFDSHEATRLNKDIFETIYFAALTASKDLAKRFGPYASYDGSPVSRGILQFDMWGVKPESKRWDWDALRAEIKQHGVRNSLLGAPMPTATTSQILGNNECLDEDTPVTLECGLAIPIRDVGDAGARVYGWDSTARTVRVATQSRKIDQGRKACVSLTLLDGRTIECTPDHRFLTPGGKWVEARNLQVGVSKIVSGPVGAVDVADADERGYELETATATFSAATPAARYKMLAFARVLGYVSTAGRIPSKPGASLSCAVGCRADADALSRDLQLLDGQAPRAAQHSTAGRSTIRVCVHGRLADAIRSLSGVTRGTRSAPTATLPRFLLEPRCPKAVVREFLAGFFGGSGAGSVGGGSGASGADSPPSGTRFLVAKLETSAHEARSVLETLGRLLDRVGVPGATVRSHRNGAQWRLCVPTNSDFATRVGLRYCVSELRRLTLSTSYWRYCETAIAAGSRPSSAVDYLAEVGVVGVTEWKGAGRDATSLPSFEVRVVARHDVGTRHVWDLSVDTDHSFVANGMMVHNCFEPYTSNLYVRRTLAGEFVCVSRHLLSDLIALGLWSPQLKNQLIAHNGSVQRLDVPQEIKDLYKTVWEISQRKIIDMAADRGAFIDQSHSLNIHMPDPSYGKLTSMHFHAWKMGLKTGMYYLRSKPAVDAIKFTVDQSMLRETEKKQQHQQQEQHPKSTDSSSSSSSSFSSSSSSHSTTPSSSLSHIDPRTALLGKRGLAASAGGFSVTGAPIQSAFAALQPPPPPPPPPSVSTSHPPKAPENVFGLVVPSPASVPQNVLGLAAPSSVSAAKPVSYAFAPFFESPIVSDSARSLAGAHTLPLVATSSLASDPGLPSPSPRSSVFSTDLAGTSKSLTQALQGHDDGDHHLPGSPSSSSSPSESASPAAVADIFYAHAEAKGSAVATVALTPAAPLTAPEQLAAWRVERDLQKEKLYCSLTNKAACEMCSS